MYIDKLTRSFSKMSFIFNSEYVAGVENTRCSAGQNVIRVHRVSVDPRDLRPKIVGH